MTMNNCKYKEQWMTQESLDIEKLADPNLWLIKNIFFDQMNHHSFSTQRLVWLYRWLRVSDVETGSESGTQSGTEHYQNGSTFQNITNKKVKLLMDLWSKEYFHPFLTTEDAFEIISKNTDKYIIGLSSTRPGSIRISFWKEGVKHHRIDFQIHTTKEYSEIIDYDLTRLEFAIEKFIQKYYLSKTSCDYSPK